MRKYILIKTTNKKMQQFEDKKCFFNYSGGGFLITFEDNQIIRTSRVHKIEVHQESKNIYVKTKNSEYFLERICNE